MGMRPCGTQWLRHMYKPAIQWLTQCDDVARCSPMYKKGTWEHIISFFVFRKPRVCLLCENNCVCKERIEAKQNMVSRQFKYCVPPWPCFFNAWWWSRAVLSVLERSMHSQPSRGLQGAFIAMTKSAPSLLSRGALATDASSCGL